jgi:hypothetical protein
MKNMLVACVALLLTSISIADPKVTYVGLGRYACTGSVRECEPIQRRNEALELQRQQARSLEQQRQELEKQTELLRADHRRRDMNDYRQY